MKYGYSSDIKGAKASGKEVQVSPKKSYELANAIRGKPLAKAKKYLEQVIAKEVAVPYKRYDNNVPHRRGMAAGRYPVKVAQAFLKIINSAEANATALAMGKDKLRVAHIAVNLGRPIIGRRKGAANNKSTTNIQVILGE